MNFGVFMQFGILFGMTCIYTSEVVHWFQLLGSGLVLGFCFISNCIPCFDILELVAMNIAWSNMVCGNLVVLA